MNKLVGRTALVTNGSDGVGRAAALALAHGGAQILVHYNPGHDGAASLVEEIRGLGGRAEKVGIDLESFDGPNHLARRVDMVIGARLDILVVICESFSGDTAHTFSVDASDSRLAATYRSMRVLVRRLLGTLCQGSVVMIASSRQDEGSSERMGAAQSTVRSLLTQDLSGALRSRGAHVILSAPSLARRESLDIALPDCPPNVVPKPLHRAVMTGDIASVCALLTSRG